jgi:hypothetical protein
VFLAEFAEKCCRTIVPSFKLEFYLRLSETLLYVEKSNLIRHAKSNWMSQTR